MEHSSKDNDTLAQLRREVRRMRLVFGTGLIAISLMLAIVLPSIIKNTLFRASEDPSSIGIFTKIIYGIRGEEIPSEKLDTLEEMNSAEPEPSL